MSPESKNPIDKANQANKENLRSKVNETFRLFGLETQESRDALVAYNQADANNQPAKKAFDLGISNSTKR